jgi:phenylpropionate dioxygenase-like ring-hydroxylating dioxygenase large terminal subunit
VTIDEQRVSVRRSPGPSYQDIVAGDSHGVPAHFREERPGDFGIENIPIHRYTSREYYEAEKRHVWRKVWQSTCREEHIPEVGDIHVYDICDMSFLVVRAAPDTIKAYWNFCRHRGRQIHNESCRAEKLRCSFHGFTWNLDGSMSFVPSAWDFPQIDTGNFGLIEAKVGVWGGWVFINPDPDAEPLEQHLGELPEHFAPWRLEDRYVEAHVAKIYDANWKIVQEAFMESFHVAATHPQQLVRLGDTNSQHDCYENFNRSLHPSGTPSPHLDWAPTEQEMLDSMLDVRVDEESPVLIPEGHTLRDFAAGISREALREVLGDSVEALSDTELVDAMEYSVFPNFHPWASYQRVLYRFRPYGDDHRKAVMEVILLSPFTGPRPAPAPIQWVKENESWTVSKGLGITAQILDQDSFNLPKVQKGLRTAPVAGLAVSAYQESRIRHFHHLLDRHIPASERG